MEIPTDRLHVTCKPCQHTWVAAYLPMDTREMSRLMARLACPRCAQKKTIYMASKEEAASLYPEAVSS